MATILIVEDHALSRQALTTLLGYYGHRLLEATDGLQALAIARSEPLDLIITDIVMPNMDGIEFIRLLRAEKKVEAPVIFYTATYRLPEARRLVEGFGNCHVVPKPSEPVDILRIVNRLLGMPTEPPLPPAPNHLDVLSKWTLELHLAALMDLSFHLLSQRDPERLLEISCDAIRNILNCRYVRLGLLQEGEQIRYLGAAEGDEPSVVAASDSLPLEEILAQVVTQRQTLKRPVAGAVPGEAAGQDLHYQSLLVIPFASQNRVYGWFALADKLNSSSFGDEDEEMAVALGTQTALAYENRIFANEMKRAKEAAEAAAGARSQFLANMSHELRTPMTGVLGMLDLALEGELDPQQRDFVETARSSASSLVRILNDILDLTKIEKGKLSLDQKPFSVRKCAKDTIALLVPVARSKGIELEMILDDEVPQTLIGDQMRIGQVLTNLVGNAVKFTEQGKVQLRVSAGDSASDGKRHITFTVADTGIGIPEDRKHVLFHAFSQVDESHSRRYGGTGLGLVISKEIVELMGGAICCTSEEGKGSVFSCSIPLGDSEPARNLVSSPGQAVAAEEASQLSQSKARILLAEDDQVISRILNTMLQRSNYQVDCADNGVSAVEMWESGAYDLVLMDVQMPRMNGFEAAGAIRELERSRGGHVPIVAMTAHALKDDERKCRGAGMDAYVSKPIDFKHSLQVIREMLGG